MAKQEESNAWEKETIIFIEGEAGEGDPVVENRHIESYGEEDPGETTLIRLRYADGCGHVIHSGAEVGGVCACGRLLCSKCSDNICRHCGKRVCPQHLRRLRRGEEEIIYCWECWPGTVVKHGLWLCILGLARLLKMMLGIGRR